MTLAASGLEGLLYERRSIDHQDERRVLTTAFNGDFKAKEIFIVKTGESCYSAKMELGDNSSRTLLYALQGDSWLMLRSAGDVTKEAYHLLGEAGRKDCLIVPAGASYDGGINPNSILVACSESGKRDFLRTHIAKTDEMELFYPLPLGENFVAAQLKFALVNSERKVVLGGHYHLDYWEMFTLLQGRAVFTTENIDSKERKETSLNVGERIFLPSGLAHRAVLDKSSILVGCTGKPYVSPQENDRKYEFG